MSGKPCVFFDRDGVVNRSPGPGYVTRWEDFTFMPGIEELLRVVCDSGYQAVVVTSQRGVGRGIMSREELDRIHHNMQSALAEHGLAFLDVYACTYTEADAHWAKPNPDMILEAAAKHGLDLARSLLIGDMDRDIQMARNAGLPLAIRLRNPEKELGIEADETFDNLLEVKEWWESAKGPAG